jgi:DNA-binding HxlR family transcriptional regulator
VAKQSSSAADRRAERAARATPSGLRVPKGVDSVAPALDKIIHEHIRLGIATALAVNERLTFNELKQLLHTSDGNVSVHARKLEDAGYVACMKSFDGRVPKTEYKLTAAGRKALDRYLSAMEALIQAARGK